VSSSASRAIAFSVIVVITRIHVKKTIIGT
jgi:hypothetical protein